MKFVTPALIAFSLAATAAHAEPSIDQMRSQRRVLLLAAPRSDDARLTVQRRLLADWKRDAEERDISVVEVIGDVVRGSSDAGATVRRKWHLPVGAFTVILIGKDGHEALRSPKPLSGNALSARIDEMPMRRAGGR